MKHKKLFFITSVFVFHFITHPEIVTFTYKKNGKNKKISSNSDETSLTCSIKQFLAQHDEPETPIIVKHNGRTTTILKKNIAQQLFAFVNQIKR